MKDRLNLRAVLSRVQRLCQCLMACTFAALSSEPLYADEQITQIPFEFSKTGSVGLGAGLRFGTSPYKHVETLSSLENENSADLVPLYLVEGKHLFSHGTRAGIHLLKSPFFIDTIAQYRFDRLESDSHEFYRTVNDRRQTLEAGLSTGIYFDNSRLNLTWVADTLDRHNGHEAALTYRHHFEAGRFHFFPYASAIYQNQSFVDYYFGVSAEESRDDLPTYTATEAYLARAGLNTSIRLFDNWLLFANASYEWLDSTISDSPLTDKDNLAKYFIGFSYNFGNIWQPTKVANKAQGYGDWSWRVHTGYTAEETFHKVHRGAVKSNELVDTYLLGTTFGRLLTAGKRADFWAKASINRRLENDLQDNFNEYNFYVMAMGTGYKGWTNKELFRYGFGFGFSYADEVPIVEKLKQEERERNDARFLNYLEAQVDFPFRNLTKADSLANCYYGLSIIHRSGIFANSDILGNVAGGSDVLAGHIECKR